MPLGIFVDALPYTAISTNYKNWFSKMQVAELQPNIGYSSSLHWQLFCDNYPDDTGAFVDWVKENETNKSISMLSTIFSWFDSMGEVGTISRKILDRFVYRRNAFANIPYKFRRNFSEKGTYLFWEKRHYEKEDIFLNYTVISQDESHRDFTPTLVELENVIATGEKRIFAVFGFSDEEGHKCRRGEVYDHAIAPYMDKLHDTIQSYILANPNEEVMIISDHGMSTINSEIDLKLREKFGNQGENNYIAYCDSAIMCVFAGKDELRRSIAEYLSSCDCGHLLTEEDRKYYGVTNRKFGDLIFILREGNVFSENWFGKSLRKPNTNGAGMHGFWPNREARDQMGTFILLNGKRELMEFYNYREANKIIWHILQGHD